MNGFSSKNLAIKFTKGLSFIQNIVILKDKTIQSYTQTYPLLVAKLLWPMSIDLAGILTNQNSLISK